MRANRNFNTIADYGTMYNMKESIYLRFLYNTMLGRHLLKLLVQPYVSKAAARFLSSSLSRPLIKYYLRKYQIDLTNCKKRKFDSFNDFFIRKKHLQINANDFSVISPCDGYLSVYRIEDDLRMSIKHSTYAVNDLLENNDLAAQFMGGICCVFRLEPHHYHRYVYAVSGVVQQKKMIPGILHCVRPVACEKYPVYIRNSREYTLIHSDTLDSVIQMEIGALLVGKICNDPIDSTAKCGREKGYFEYGGSTIVLLFQRDKIQLLPKFQSLIGTEREIPVVIGQNLLNIWS